MRRKVSRGERREKAGNVSKRQWCWPSEASCGNKVKAGDCVQEKKEEKTKKSLRRNLFK